VVKEARPAAAHRQGPRPLGLHLASAAIAWMSSFIALPLSRNGSLTWKPELAGAARALQQSLAGVAPEALAEAVETELRARADAFLRGLTRYRHHPYRRALRDPPVVWQEGTTRLLDYGPAGARPVLVVPSLVNRAYILDLAEDKSLLRFLSGVGLRPMLVDWAEPGEVERDFTLSDYVAGRLEAAATIAAGAAGSPVAVIGYCMGGLLALALAERRPELVSALALLATPWDFHAERPGQARLLGRIAQPLMQGCAALGEVPVDVLQAFFAALDPLLALRKFSRFATLPEGSAEERDFVALEDWLNDGVPLALPVMRECLAGWYGANTPARGLWQIVGRPVVPSRITVPSLAVIPAQDRIVPPASAAALAERLPRGQRLALTLGHIGMVVAREAPIALWQPLADWLRRPASATGSQSRRRGLSKRMSQPDLPPRGLR
jgi:polyhydroxyalkanoate synthase